MMSRSSPPAAATFSLLALSWLLAVTALVAQTPLGTPAPRTPKTKVTHLRFVNVLPLDGAILELFGAASTDAPVQVAPPSNFYVSYLSLPPVRATFRVFRRGNLQTAIKSVDVPMKPDGYYTILARPQADGQPVVEVIDESPNPDLPLTNRLTIRQCFRGTRVVVTAAGRVHSNPLDYGEAQTLADMPDGTVPLAIIATTVPGAPPRNINNEANFQHGRRVTIYIIADAYDRMRPRTTTDGPSRAEEDAALAELHNGAAPTSTQ